MRTKNRQAYEARLRDLAGRYGVQASGRVTDPAVLFKLQHRAAFAANSVRNTLEKEIQRTQLKGGSLSDLLASRSGYKPDQVFVTETNTADQMALRDFYDNHTDLRDQQTYHVEPPDAKEDLCQSWIDMGSMPLDQFPGFPLHVSCPHGLEPDDVSRDTVMVPAGTMTQDGGYIDTAITVATATADVLNGIKWWLGGMLITAAMGDRKKDQQQQPTEETAG